MMRLILKRKEILEHTLLLQIFSWQGIKIMLASSSTKPRSPPPLPNIEIQTKPLVGVSFPTAAAGQMHHATNLSPRRGREVRKMAGGSRQTVPRVGFSKHCGHF
jgi:hypothetical protein